MFVFLVFFIFSFAGRSLGTSESFESEEANLCDDPNAIFKLCPDPCPATCDDRYPPPCNEPCIHKGCECAPGFILNEIGGKCIRPEDCPAGCKGDLNASWVECTSLCPLTCAERDPNKPCPAVCYPPGCECNYGFMLTEIGGVCIKPEDCPPEQCNGDHNATFSGCPSACPASCDEPNEGRPCIDMCMPSGCVCKPGYLLFNDCDGSVCIRPEDCPGGSPKCRANETYVSCKINCPTNYCPDNDSRNTVICDPFFPCPGGCVCKPGYLLRSYEDERCILSSECPPVNCTRPNEVWDPNPSSCLRERCDDTDDICDFPFPMPPRCVCKTGYCRDQNDVCVPICDNPCSIPDECKRTCARPNPPNCPYSPSKVNINGCNCKEGYILSEKNGLCTKIEHCPRNLGCNGDPHAITKQCPLPCPSTCQTPNAVQCKRMCEPIGCECEPGYLLSELNGKCILPDCCSGGNPCDENEHFVPCKARCSGDYCPVNDTREVGFCKLPDPCLPGCVCDLNHKRKSIEDPRCILSSDCPPVKCTRPNEIWNPCPSACLAENCEDINNQPSTCNTLVLNCEPRCICKKNHFRNASGICVPAKDCPCSIPDECKRTCARPNPPNCPYSPSKINIDGCNCKEGYILSKLDGNCIKIEHCPRDLGCNGDPHAITKVCPLPCPSTCDRPNAVHCLMLCEPIGCECEPGYLLSDDTGKCILPDECPCGNPCGENEHFVPCKNECPEDFCQGVDGKAKGSCKPPNPCLSGCVCDKNYKRKSYEDYRCILESDCPC